MAVGQFDGHNLPEVAVLGTTTISVLLNDSGAAGPAVAAPASVAGQIVGTGLTSNRPRQTLLLTPAEAGIGRGVDLGVFSGVSGVIDEQTRTLPPLDTAVVDQTQRPLPPLDTAAVDQFFATVAKADQQLGLAYYSLRPRHLAANANGDDFSGSL
jgi:hypothetical protein